MSTVDDTPVRAVLFDLDGTLLDTAGDMAVALNALLAEQGQAPLPYADIRLKVSHGGAALVELGWPGLRRDDQSVQERFEALRLRLLALYRADLCRHTCLFDGFEPVLGLLESRGIALGVVTNKPGWLTEPLLTMLGLRTRMGTVISGDTFAERKPHPRPLLAAAEELGLPPVSCLYVGDALRDIQAANSAGMRSVVARFGYIAESDGAESWPADVWIDHPRELLALLDQPPRKSPARQQASHVG